MFARSRRLFVFALGMFVASTAFTGCKSDETAAAKPDAATAEAKPAAPNPKVQIQTSMGPIELELFRDKAPISVENFLSYVSDKSYDGTIFHRVIDGFMIQGGGFGTDLQKRPTKAPIKNEADNGLKNVRGTIAMARTGIVDSATSQFFINVKDNVSLNHRSPDQRGFGYAVFGKVTSGMEVVDQIKAVKTGACPPRFMKDCPATQVVIQNVTVLK